MFPGQMFLHFNGTRCKRKRMFWQRTARQLISALVLLTIIASFIGESRFLYFILYEVFFLTSKVWGNVSNRAT